MFEWVTVWPYVAMRRLVSSASDIEPEPTPEPERPTWGQLCADVAEETLGWGEGPRNNVGEDLDVMRRRPGLTGAWCAAAASYWIEESFAGLLRGDKWAELNASERAQCSVKRSHGARNLWANVAKAGRIVETPKRGDLVLWKRGQGWQGHIGIVSQVWDETFETVEGNKGRYPSRVRRYVHEFGERDFLGFARLPES